jgi:transcriptional regulator with XRE-family HTH domain
MPRRKKPKQPVCLPIARRIGEGVRKRREALGLSQERLAEMADISKNYAGNIERGEYDATIGTLARVARSLGCRVADLLDEADV